MDAQAELKRLTEQLNQMNQRQGLTPITTPATIAAPQVPVTADQVSAIVEASLKRAMPELMSMVKSLDDFFDKALPPDDLAAFKAYRDQGAPGLKELMASDTLHPIAQLLWDEIKSHAIKLMEKKS
jgi:hypothetical protein